MKPEQFNLFGEKRISFSEQVDLTIQSMNAYGESHKHWGIAWSMGKDSTTVMTLIIQLIQTGQIKAPESLTIFRADTRMEIPPLWIAGEAIREKAEALGFEVRTVCAPLDLRYFVYILGRGVPPPSNTFRWCTPNLKVLPMERELKEYLSTISMEDNTKALMLTGVRIGESAIRDQRIALSCGKDGSECGQGWYQEKLANDVCATLAPILHWRVCTVWDWLKIFAPMPKYGAWPSAMIADAYGGDEAEELNARTGCIGCPLASKDKALDYVCSIPYWNYIRPLLELKPIYREMRHPSHRLRKNGEYNKDGKLGKNQQRMGPLHIEARIHFLDRILNIQNRINSQAKVEQKPEIYLINTEEEARIRELISLNTYPNRWDGTEIRADVPLDKLYEDGSIMKILF